MNALRLGLLATALITLSMPAIAETDEEGSSDHPLLSRYPGFYIDTYKSTEFNRAQIITSAMDDGSYDLRDVEGQVTNIEYRIRNESISGFQLYSNYRNALENLDAEFIFSCFGQEECGGSGNDFYNESVPYAGLFGGDRIDFFNEFGILSAKVTQDGQDAHIMIVTAANNNDRRRVHQTIVRSAALDVDNIGIGTIESVSTAIAETGTVVLDGVYFASGTAELTVESDATLDVAAAYLSENAQTSYFIVGHTDWEGSYDLNLSLSEDRAQSVVNALVNRGVSDERLTSVGIGPVSPVANNGSEAGRTLNRRVELVLQQ